MNISKEKLKKLYKDKQDNKKVEKTKSKCVENKDGFLEIRNNDKYKKVNAEKHFNKCGAKNDMKKKKKKKKRRKSL